MSENREPQIAPKSWQEHVRLRPHMYFGTTDSSALHQLVFYILELPVDAALVGTCSHIEVTLHPNHTITIADNSPGIPVEIYEHLGVSRLEMQFSHNLPGFPRNFETSTVNVVCSELIAEVKRDGYLWQQTYSKGIPTSPVIRVRPLEQSEITGTTITFTPDFTILQPNEFNYTALAWRFRELVCLVPGLTITFKDKREKPEGNEISFCYQNGLVDLLAHLNRNHTPLHSPICRQGNVEWTTNNRSKYTVDVEVAFQYVEQTSSIVLSYVNTHETLEGGTHVAGLLRALASFVSERINEPTSSYIHRNGVDATMVVQGLTAVVHVKHPSPSIESQLESRLINPDADWAVFEVTSNALNQFAQGHPDEMRKLINHLVARKREWDTRRFDDIS
jgi:DNA gyrase subunit B